MKGSKKLIMSVFALVVTLAMATTSTFAWFTMNREVTTGDININVTSGTEGLYFRYIRQTLSADEKLVAGGDNFASSNALNVAYTDWDKLLDSTDYESADYDTWSVANKEKAYLAYLNAKAVFVSALSTTDIANITLDLTNLNMTACNTTDGYEIDKYSTNPTNTPKAYLEEAEATVANVDYAQLKFEFTIDQAKDVYLGGSTSISSDGKSTQKAWVGFDGSRYADDNDAASYTGLTAGSPIPVKAWQAARISFILDTTTTASTIWNPNGDDGDKSLQADYLAYGLGWGAGDPTNYILSDYDATYDYSQEKSATPAAIFTADDFTAGTHIVTICVWLHGNDSECMNGIFNDDITLSLEFTTNVIEAMYYQAA